MKHIPSLALVLSLTACADVAVDPDDPITCAWSNGPHAGVIADGGWVPEGPDALAHPGDALLANGRAAFVIQGPDDPRTYYHYGGILIDAVPLDGCAQTAPEQYGELGITPARLELLDFVSSSMRQFRAERLEIVDDGATSGVAHVRVTGTDDRFWLVDHALTRDAAGSGRRRPLSDPMGTEIVVDYTLARDSAALRIDLTVRNTTDAVNRVALGGLTFPSDLTEPLVYNEDSLSFGGFGIRLNVPWYVAASDEVAYALAMEGNGMGFTDVSGAQVLLDPLRILGNEGTLQPSGMPGDANTTTWWVSTAAGDEAAAVAALLDAGPVLGPASVPLRHVSGRVVGATVPAWVDVERLRSDGSWALYSRLRADGEGAFEGRLPDVEGLRLRARAGRHPSSPWLDLPQGAVDGASLALGEVGRLHVTPTDGDDPMPAKVSVYEEGALVFELYAPAAGERFELPVGTWEVSVTRGYEYAPVHTTVEITAGAETPFAPVLPHVLDTEGWLSVDGHVHTSPSPDSDVLPERRFATAATAGLDVMVQTDHEIIVDLQDQLEASPWAGFLATVLGEEVTATSPEHLNMWGIDVGPEDGPRGAPVVWYGRDIDQLYGDMRARGAAIVQLNHPSWMDLIGYDPLTGAPTLDDPTLLGFEADAALWSWNLDAIELQNGFKDIFGEVDRPGSSGLFVAWQSFFNHGHRVTGVGVSDVHGMQTPGTPRTYVPVPDDLDAFVEGPMLAAVKAGQAVSSAGAFLTVRLGNDDVGFDTTLGETLSTADPVAVRIAVQALPGIRIDRAVVFANCDAVAAVDATDPDGVRKLSTDVPLDLDQDAHVTVAVFGSGAYPRGLEQPGPRIPRAVSNPIFLDVDGNGVFDAPGGKTCDLALVPR